MTLKLKELLTKLTQNVICVGEWYPHVYDNTTLLRSLPKQRYYKIGPLYISGIYITDTRQQFSNVSTMLQFRNAPWRWTLGGQFYCSRLANDGANITIQASDVGVYFRPNITSSQLASASGGISSILLIGSDYSPYV